MLDPLPATDRESGAGVDTPAPDADSSASQDAGCFHCGLPVASSLAPPSLEVLGDQRYFCCPGCQAVCKAIVDAGLEDYYRHRTESAVSAVRPLVPEFLKQLDLYDYPEIQKDFVREGDNWREASLILEDIRERVQLRRTDEVVQRRWERMARMRALNRRGIERPREKDQEG